jgi:methylglutaconyl-CoA hydratase
LAFFSDYCISIPNRTTEQLPTEQLVIMDFKTIKVQLGESMAWVNLDRPEVRNALNAELIRELTEVFDWLNSRDDIRVIILKGNGPAFCAGADLAYMKDMAGFSYNQNIADAEKLSKLFQTIYYCDKAVIVDVHGACIGGANGIIAAADIVIAEKNTKFAFSEVRLGITPATISPFVVSKIGTTAAKELMLTGRRFTANEAKDFRLVNVVVGEAEMIDTERQYIDHFLQASPDAIAECKNLLRMVTGTDDRYNPVFMQTSVAIANQRISKAGQEGMKAFFEKRKPEWCH